MASDEEILYSLWINDVCKHNPDLIHKCNNLGFTPEEIYRGEADKKAIKSVLKNHYSALKRKDLSGAESILKCCRDENIRILLYDDEEYPFILKNVYMPPRILYTKGEELNLNDYLTITVIGSRKGSDKGEELTCRLSYDMAAAGAVIVSGMALKFDAAAHMGALLAGQKTVAVLAGGVNVIYPKENTDLYEKILNQGMIVSERPPEMAGRAHFYQERNRILIGLSYGLLVTEGRKDGGTSITVKHGWESNRDMFAVPGNPSDEMSYVPNSMLHDGAVVTLTADDVIGQYELVYEKQLENGRANLKHDPPPFEEMLFELDRPKQSVRHKKSDDRKPKKEKENKENKRNEKPDFSKYNKEQVKILEFLYESGSAEHMDEIIRATGLETSAVSNMMLLLQIDGAVKQSMGNLYTLNI